MQPRIALVWRRGLARLAAIAEEAGVPVVSAVDDLPSDPSPQLVLFLCDHPDAFASQILAAAERWPLSEIVVVDSDWGLSACRTRREVPAGWRVDEATAVTLLQDTLAGRRAPEPRPRTYSRQERVTSEPFNMSDWPRLDRSDPAVAEVL